MGFDRVEVFDSDAFEYLSRVVVCERLRGRPRLGEHRCEMQVVGVHRLVDELVPKHAVLFDGHLVGVVGKRSLLSTKARGLNVGVREHSCAGLYPGRDDMHCGRWWKLRRCLRVA